MFTLLKEMNIFKLESFGNIVAKEEIVGDVITSIYGVKG